MTEEMLFLKAIDYMMKFLKKCKDKNEKEKQMKDSALEVFRDAIVATRSYFAVIREEISDRDREKELELSRAWNAVALRIKNINTKEAQKLYEVCFSKADYWSDPTWWRENKDSEIDISLSRLDREISQLLK